jgi:signal transduction histidine kinase
MPQEVASRAFEPFFTTKPVGQGTGLGLSQVFGIATRAGGTVRIESKLNEGTAVHLFLRCTEYEGGTIQAESQLPSAVLPKIRAVLVDDDPDVRTFLKDL